MEALAVLEVAQVVVQAVAASDINKGFPNREAFFFLSTKVNTNVTVPFYVGELLRLSSASLQSLRNTRFRTYTLPR